MFNIISKPNNQKGFFSVGLLVALAAVTIMIGGFSLAVGDILNESKDLQRIANLRQITTAMELYYSDYQNYPQVSGDTASERFDNFISELSNYLNSLPTDKEKYDYQNYNFGQNYILKVILENPKSSYFEASLASQIQDTDCPKPYYCIKN